MKKVDFFSKLNSSYFKILYNINRYNTISKLNKEIDVSINTTIIISKELVQDELIYKKKEGRQKILCYTPKGIEMFNKLSELVTIFNTFNLKENNSKVNKKT